MRFHHSTRRGRNRLNAAGASHSALAPSGVRPGGASQAATRWALNYCKDTNIHFNRRLPIEPPASLLTEWQINLPNQPLEGLQQHQQLHLATALADDDDDEPGQLLAADHHQLVEQRKSLDSPHRQGAKLTDRVPLESKMRLLSLSPSGDLGRPPLDASHNHISSKSQPDHTMNVTSNDGTSIIKNKNKNNITNINSRVTIINKEPEVKLRGKMEEHEVLASGLEAFDVEQVREQLVRQVRKHPFWSNKAAKRMDLELIEQRRIYIYELISFCERRQLEWRYEPYKGGLVKTVPHTGNASSLNAKPTTTSPSVFHNFESRPLDLALARSLPGSPLVSQDLAIHPMDCFNSNSPNRQLISTDSRLTTTASSFKPQQQQHMPKITIDDDNNNNNNKHEELFESKRRPSQKSLVSSSKDRRSLMGRSSSASYTSTSQILHPGGHSDSIRLTAAAPTLANELPVGGGGIHVGNNGPVEALGSLQRPLPSSDYVWSIPLDSRLEPVAFKHYAHSSELPNSSFVKACHGCQGKGRLKCKSCHGVGYEVCISCSGKGSTRIRYRDLQSSHLNGTQFDCSYKSRGLDSGAGGLFGSASSSANDSGDAGRQSGAGSMALTGPSASGRSRAGDSKWNGSSSSAAARNQKASGFGGSQGIGLAGSLSESCHLCHGTGQKRCWVCAGKSYNHCPGCLGAGQVRCFLTLHVIYLNHRDESCLNNSDSIIPKERLRLAKSELILEDEQARLEPPSAQQLEESIRRATEHSGSASSQVMPPSTIKLNRTELGSLSRLNDIELLQMTSSRLLEKHRQTYRNERLIRQRHSLSRIQVQLVAFQWKGRSGTFVIYGNERKVYIAKYPFKSLCNIT